MYLNRAGHKEQTASEEWRCISRGLIRSGKDIHRLSVSRAACAHKSCASRDSFEMCLAKMERSSSLDVMKAITAQTEPEK